MPIKIEYYLFRNEGSQAGALVSQERIRAMTGRLLKSADDKESEVAGATDEVKAEVKIEADKIRANALSSLDEYNRLRKECELVELEGPGISLRQEMEARKAASTFENGTPGLKLFDYLYSITLAALGKDAEWFDALEPAVALVVMDEVQDKIQPDPERKLFLSFAPATSAAAAS